MAVKWGQVVETLCALHAEDLCSLSPRNSTPFTDFVDKTGEGSILQIEGRVLDEKVVKKWLWGVRKQAVQADGLWAYYDERGQRSFVGIAQFVNEESEKDA